MKIVNPFQRKNRQARVEEIQEQVSFCVVCGEPSTYYAFAWSKEFASRRRWFLRWRRFAIPAGLCTEHGKNWRLVEPELYFQPFFRGVQFAQRTWGLSKAAD